MPAARVHTLPDESATSSDPEGGGSVGTPYQRLLHSLHHDQRWLTEVNLGKRVGFYRFRGDLGSGNFSQVKMAVHQLTKERVAVKILDKAKLDQKTRRMLAREIATMEAIHHPNIIRLYEVVETYSKIHLVMEYASGGELFNKITTAGKIPENEAKTLFAQVISAVQYMHEHDFIHRDIKAENVFYAGPALVKLGDFGFSTQLTTGSGQQLNTFCGSPPYAAPELFRDESYLGAPVDIWALGVLLYFMVTAQMPFKAQTVATLKKHILEGVFTIPGHVSFQCRKVIEGILKKAPRERLGLQEIRNSDWLKGVIFPTTPGPSENYSLSPTFQSPVPRTPENHAETVPGKTDSKENVSVSGENKESVGSGSDLVAGKSGESGAYRPSSGDDTIAVERETLSRQESYSGSEKKETDIYGTEMLARKKLLDFGITSAMLEEHSSRGARSAVIGTYRIVIHRIQRQGYLDVEAASMDDTDGSPSAVPSRSPSTNHFFLSSFGRRSKSAAVKSKGHKPEKNNRSRTCIIL
ncbi:serine/threonine-protein kinase NIM1 [Periplaneta americana]|uniref:serine/threonine-protein kinase NIM1 n=1 Tax=Periplaneta americana TaxID=6978 RepID=UPI0037E8091E